MASSIEHNADNAKQTNTVPIHVRDLDLQRTNDFVVTVNFDRDATGFFALVLPAFRLERITGMRCAALIEETAEHNQGGRLQESSLPVRGETL